MCRRSAWDACACACVPGIVLNKTQSEYDGVLGSCKRVYIFFFLEMWRVRYARFRFVVLRKYQTKIKRKKKTRQNQVKRKKKKFFFFFFGGGGKKKNLNLMKFLNNIKKKTLKEILKL